MSSITSAPGYVENVNRGHGEHWTDPDNVKIPDDTSTTAYAGRTDWLELQDFDFAAIPDTAQIMGVELSIHCKGLDVRDDEVYLALEGTVEGSNRAGCQEWENNENIHTLGGIGDTWGWNLTPTIVKNQYFGVNFCATKYDIGGMASIDYITLTTYYEDQADIVELCNSALAIIGEPPITDINGTDNRSRVCKTNFGPIQKRLLGSHDWLFASHMVKLRPAYGCPCFDWNFVYDLPSNFLRVVNTYPLNDAYEIGAENKIYMNGQGCLQYIANITDPALFDVHFETALVYKLALAIHPSLVKKTTTYQVLQKEVEYEIIRAISKGTHHQKHVKGVFDWTSEMRI